MAAEPRVAEGIDPNRPSAARMYDFFLGGTHNFAVDRTVGARAIELVPELPKIMKANRSFLRRAVRLTAAAGVRQFIDLGSGIPTEGNVHEIARSIQPEAKVAYVDLDPAAVVHGRSILGDDPNTVVVRADLHDADAILDLPEVRGLFDFDEPICLLMVAVLHFVPDSPRLRAALRRYQSAAAPGSYLIISHGTASARPEQLEGVIDLYTRTGQPVVFRDAERLGELLDGWDVIEPGIVLGPLWRPDPDDPTVEDPASYITLAAVARKP